MCNFANVQNENDNAQGKDTTIKKCGSTIKSKVMHWAILDQHTHSKKGQVSVNWILNFRIKSCILTETVKNRGNY